jgi:hypothetical protein
VLLEYRIIWEIYTLYTGAAGISYHLRDIYSIYRYCWNVVSSERYILHIQVLLECCIIWEIYTLYTGAAGMLYHLRYIYSIYRCCWNIVCQWFVTGLSFSPGIPVSSTNKTDRHIFNWNIVESGIKHHNLTLTLQKCIYIYIHLLSTVIIQ